eukprot:CAMPEP_0115060094 /NCGR_PEP_ID=MMETSP0227-20121206/7279_1 /TAXON_ID=89957 /ORGANISM="Polarella glacialis, Strain CCMP 1383" /LENGTH=638 /DNA_ID=CAMNT_0002445283 /DNA_START=61 /DNA_END=1977 /DNA_ORIENTATION=+
MLMARVHLTLILFAAVAVEAALGHEALGTSIASARESEECDFTSLLAKPFLRKDAPPAPAPSVSSASAALAALEAAGKIQDGTAAKAPAPSHDIAFDLAALAAAMGQPLASPASPDVNVLPTSAPDLAADLRELVREAAAQSRSTAPNLASPDRDSRQAVKETSSLGLATGSATSALHMLEDMASNLLTNVAEGFGSAPSFPPSASVSPSPKDLHTVPLTKQYVPIVRKGNTVAFKTAYFGKISVGSQDFTVVFDTGSAHLILPATTCSAEACLKHNRYNQSLSASALSIDHDGTPLAPGEVAPKSVTIQFGTGKVKGEFVRDSVCLQPLNSSTASFGCTEMRLVLASEMSAEPFSLFDFDGILGLGLEGLALHEKFSFFGQLTAQNTALQPQFSVFLARSGKGQSSISFGGHDADKAASGLSWVPVHKPEKGHWQVKIRQVRIGDVVLDDCADGECTAILDTGSSLLGAPRQTVRTMHRYLTRRVLVAPGGTGSGEGQVSASEAAATLATDCRTLAGLPLTFDLGENGPEIRLDAEDYFRPKPFNMTLPNQPSGWQLACRSLLLPLDLPPSMGSKVFVLGEPVLRKYYTVYDWASRRVGFAVAAHSAEEGVGALGAPEVGSESSLAAGSPLPLVAKR